MCAKERTLKLEKYGQKPRTQKELLFRERNKTKMLGKVSGGGDPGGRLGRTINFCSESVQRRKKSSPTSIKNNNNPYTLHKSPLQFKISHAYSVSAAVLPQAI